METIDLREVWKSSQSEFKVYTSDEIEELTTKRDKNIFRNIVKHTRVNFFIKIMVGLGFALLFLMFELPNELLLFNLSLFIITVLLGSYDIGFAKEVGEIQESSDSLANNLVRLKKFFKSNYSNYGILSSFSNPLLIIVGMEFYSLIVHGKFQLAEIDDVIVFLVMLVLSYGIALIANSRISKDLSEEIESSFVEFENEIEMTSFLIGEEKRKKKLKLFYLNLTIVGAIILFLSILFYFFYR